MPTNILFTIAKDGRRSAKKKLMGPNVEKFGIWFLKIKKQGCANDIACFLKV